jgi:4-hydroxy 2-oxovalerate aldolase
MRQVVPDLTLVDVTLRDGGYVNGHSWSRDDALTIVDTCAAAHVKYCEVGYFRPRRHNTDEARLLAACSPVDYLAELCNRHADVSVVVMAHAKDLELTDYAMLRDVGVKMVRMPAKLAVLPSLVDHVAAAREAGLRVTVNLIRASEVSPAEVAEVAQLAGECGVDAFYLADSNGSMFPDDVNELVRTAKENTWVSLGFHAHDGLSLAFINTLTAVMAGCTYVDASLGGMGKGGGNLSLELIVGYLRAYGRAPLLMTPLVQTTGTLLRPWKGATEAQSEAIASGLLDLNIDAIAQQSANGHRDLVSLVDARPVSKA